MSKDKIITEENAKNGISENEITDSAKEKNSEEAISDKAESDKTEADKAESEETKKKDEKEETGKEEKSGKTTKSNNKMLIATIVALCLVIAGLIVALVLGGKKDSNEDNSTTAEVSQGEGSDNNDNSDVSGDISTENQTSTTENASASANSDAFVTITNTNGWEGDGKYYGQMDVAINNNSSGELSSWSVSVPVASGVEVDSCWNCSCEIKDGNLVITPADYNGTIAANTKLSDIGIIIKAVSQADLDSLTKSPVLYVNGKEFESTASENENIEASTEVTTEDTEEPSSVEEKPPVEAESGTPFDNHGKLSVNGTDLVDKNGNKFQLKGVSTHGIAWFPDYVNKDAFMTLRDDWGANLIRIAMYPDENMGYCTGGDKTKLKNLIDTGVQAATELGMYVIIDWHVLGDQNPQKHKEEAKKFFQEMTEKYKNYDNVIYEICNEPNGGTSWADVKAYAEEVIPVIRKNCPDAIIIIGTPTWSQDADLAAKDPVKGYDNLMYAVHFYAATHTDNIRNKVKTALDAGIPIFISEFSICDASGNGGIDYNQADLWMQLINDKNLSYAAWSLSNKAETSALISSSCSKTSGWTDNDLSETGKWLKKVIKGN